LAVIIAEVIEPQKSACLFHFLCYIITKSKLVYLKNFSVTSIRKRKMEPAIAFDTHAYVKKLRSVGFTEDQAEVLASTQIDLIEKRLAMKRDVIDLKRDIVALRNELTRDIRESELRLKAEIHEQKANLIKWVIGIAFIQVTLIITLMKFL